MTTIDEILMEQEAKLDALLGATLRRLEVVEGPRCNRYNRAFNIAGHPYWQGCMLSGLGFFGGLA
jgi:hypothetical protein